MQGLSRFGIFCMRGAASAATWNCSELLPRRSLEPRQRWAGGSSCRQFAVRHAATTSFRWGRNWKRSSWPRSFRRTPPPNT